MDRSMITPKMKKNDNMVRQKHKHADFREKKSLRSYMPHTKIGEKKSANKTYSKLIKSIIYINKN